MKILVSLSDGNDGPEITIGRLNSTLAESEHALFSQICDVIEPAIYEGLRQCVRDGVFTKGVCYWDGTRFKLLKG